MPILLYIILIYILFSSFLNLHSWAYSPNGCILYSLRVLIIHKTCSSIARYLNNPLGEGRNVCTGVINPSRTVKVRPTANFSPPAKLKPTTSGLPDWCLCPLRQMCFPYFFFFVKLYIRRWLPGDFIGNYGLSVSSNILIFLCEIKTHI